MNERISKLCELTLKGEMFVNPVKTAFDKRDLFLERGERDTKRLCEYLLNQDPKITEFSLFTGMFNFDGSVIGDAFQRSGHSATQRALNELYLKKIDNISTMEWQHSTANYQRVLDVGLSGIINDIEMSYNNHCEEDKKSFLLNLKKCAQTLVKWAEKCSF